MRPLKSRRTQDRIQAAELLVDPSIEAILEAVERVDEEASEVFETEESKDPGSNPGRGTSCRTIQRLY